MWNAIAALMQVSLLVTVSGCNPPQPAVPNGLKEPPPATKVNAEADKVLIRSIEVAIALPKNNPTKSQLTGDKLKDSEFCANLPRLKCKIQIIGDGELLERSQIDFGVSVSAPFSGGRIVHGSGGGTAKRLEPGKFTGEFEMTQTWPLEIASNASMNATLLNLPGRVSQSGMSSASFSNGKVTIKQEE
jgi:hypothetical protein